MPGGCPYCRPASFEGVPAMRLLSRRHQVGNHYACTLQPARRLAPEAHRPRASGRTGRYVLWEQVGRLGRRGRREARGRRGEGGPDLPFPHATAPPPNPNLPPPSTAWTGTYSATGPGHAAPSVLVHMQACLNSTPGRLCVTRRTYLHTYSKPSRT